MVFIYGRLRKIIRFYVVFLYYTQYYVVGNVNIYQTSRSHCSRLCGISENIFYQVQVYKPVYIINDNMYNMNIDKSIAGVSVGIQSTPGFCLWVGDELIICCMHLGSLISFYADAVRVYITLCIVLISQQYHIEIILLIHGSVPENIFKFFRNFTKGCSPSALPSPG